MSLEISHVAVGTAIARRPRTDPGERNYRTGLPPRVMTSNRQSGQGCRSFGLGSQRSAIRIIRRHATLLEVRIEDRLAGRAPAPPGYLGESAILH